MPARMEKGLQTPVGPKDEKKQDEKPTKAEVDEAKREAQKKREEEFLNAGSTGPVGPSDLAPGTATEVLTAPSSTGATGSAASQRVAAVDPEVLASAHRQGREVGLQEAAELSRKERHYLVARRIPGGVETIGFVEGDEGLRVARTYIEQQHEKNREGIREDLVIVDVDRLVVE